jgi:hypothetical protein
VKGDTSRVGLTKVTPSEVRLAIINKKTAIISERLEDSEDVYK